MTPTAFGPCRSHFSTTNVTQHVPAKGEILVIVFTSCDTFPPFQGIKNFLMCFKTDQPFVLTLSTAHLPFWRFHKSCIDTIL